MEHNPVGMNIKIDAELKERVRQHAELNNVNLSVASAFLFKMALDSLGQRAEVSDEIDNQHTEEADVRPFSSSEIKSLRKLLKKKK
ncbi:MAG TPA: hypothetical protein VJY31_03180 [Buttiauxella sp.]|nr:hypothetical protein [Buttiauxella sp.]